MEEVDRLKEEYDFLRSDTKKKFDEIEFTPLTLAVQKHYTQMVAVLTRWDKKAINHFDGWGFSALHTAALYGYDDITRSLLLSHGDVNIKDKRMNLSPLFLSAEMGHASTVRVLMSSGADVNEVYEDDGFALLHRVAFDHDLAKVMELLLTYSRLDVNIKSGPRSRDWEKATPLHVAVG